MDLEEKLKALTELVNTNLLRLQNAINKLGAVSDLEWSNDLNEWVSREKLKELKRNPR